MLFLKNGGTVERWNGGKQKQTAHQFDAPFRFLRSTVPPFHSSDFVIHDPRGLSTVFSDVDLKVRKKARRLRLQETQQRDRHPPDLQLRALAAPQLEHRP